MTAIPIPDFPTQPNPNTVAIQPDVTSDLGHTAVSSEDVGVDFLNRLYNMSPGSSHEVDKVETYMPMGAVVTPSESVYTPKRLAGIGEVARTQP